jgi:outer membrane lipoprotein-sorting protein
MNRRHFLSLAAAGILFPLDAEAAKVSVSQINKYLNAMRSASGKFIQANPDGTLSQGKLFLKKPGRIRFEYTTPKTSLVMANGGSVAVFDYKTRRGPQRYPLTRTPLRLLLESRIDLSKTGAVKSVTSDGVETRVTAVDPKRPRQGSLQMVFTGNPTELRQWVVRDAQGRKTTVILNDLRTGVSLSNRLFNIEFESQRRKG